MFEFDTDHLGILQFETGPEHERLKERLHGFAESDMYVSMISFHEEVLGWNAYIKRAHDTQGVVRGYGMYQRILTDFSKLNVLPFDESAAIVFESLRKQRIRIATMDLRIASIVLSRNFTVVTRNTIDFQRVPNLKIEDWTVA